MSIFIPEFCILLFMGLSDLEATKLSQKYFQTSPMIPTSTLNSLEVLYQSIHTRLDNRQLTIINATLLDIHARQHIRTLAQKNHCKIIVMIINSPISTLKATLKQIKNEKYHRIISFKDINELKNTDIKKVKLSNNLRDRTGPFDIIGDIHGCYDELLALLNKLGYYVNESLIEKDTAAVQHPENRQVIFLGDLVDRGPASKKVVNLVMNMCTFNTGLCIKGNHEDKFIRYLMGKKVKLNHGLEITAAEYPLSDQYDIRTKTIKFLYKLKDHFVLDQGRLVVAHAGLKESLQGRDSSKVISFALYGDTTGQNNENGLPIRNDWTQTYQGKALVVYGHTPIKTPQVVNNTLCIDTGCVFGGKLTALKYPERELISVPAKQKYCPHPDWS